MTNFYVLDGGKKQGTAVNTEKATEMLSLIFPGQKAFVVDDGKVPFAQNMTIAEAEDSAGIKSIEPVVEPVTQFMEVLPDEPIKVKSKVVVKSKPAKTIKVKSKVVVGKSKKPVKKPVAKKKNVKKK